MKNSALLLVVLMIFFGCAPASQTTPPSPLPAARQHARHSIIDYDLALDGQLASLAQQVSVQLTQWTSRHVGLKGFHDLRGGSGRFEKYLEVEFVNRLIRTGQFQVYAPDELARLEHQGRFETLETDGGMADMSRRITLQADPIDAFIVGSTVDLPQGV